MTRYTPARPPTRGDSVHNDSFGLGRVVDPDSAVFPGVGVDFGDGWTVYLAAWRLRPLDLPQLDRPNLDDLPASPEDGNLCDYCTDGLQPAGLHDDLGPVFTGCESCYGTCQTCQGDGLFPADETCIGCYANNLAARGLIADRCPNCFGICDLIPITGTQEVNPHGHRD